jgi:competence CoiA-like predicted nuclease
LHHTDRSIKYAVNKDTGEILEAEKYFDSKSAAFQERKNFARGQLSVVCYECGQDLLISSSKKSVVHFKHYPGHEPCLLTSGDLSIHELEGFNAVLEAKESERHIFLKNKIGSGLAKIEGIEERSIAVDNRFIKHGDQKRRPDVYCKFRGREIVFEIQISPLSLKYILSRHDFYKEHGIYLIWILDSFDFQNQGPLEKDIKYLWKHQNFFRLNEKCENFVMQCEYKKPFLNASNEYQEKWSRADISLDCLKYDEVDFQAYYFDLPTKSKIIYKEQKERSRLIRKEQEVKVESPKSINVHYQVDSLLECIKNARKFKWPDKDYEALKKEVDTFDDDQLLLLNQKLDLKNIKIPILRWIGSAKSNDYGFLKFIFSTEGIDKNLKETDENGSNAFFELMNNKNLSITNRIKLLQVLLEHEYELTGKDLEQLRQIVDFKDLILLELSNGLRERRLVPMIFEDDNSEVILIIESIKRKEIIGYNYKENIWLRLALNAIEHYNGYWTYLEAAFRYYGLWSEVIEADKTGKFNTKPNKTNFYQFGGNLNFRDIMRELYPEIYFNMSL